MKLRVKPEDFLVDEITNLSFLSDGEYSIYILKKKNIETIEIFYKLANKFGLMREQIGFAGIKDKHAITTQYISILKKYNIKDILEENYSLRFVGYLNEPIKTGNLEGNRFRITIRDLKKDNINNLVENIRRVETNGVINYFDSQRFGNVKDNMFIAKFLAKNDYENAVFYFLLSQYSFKNSVNIDKEYNNLKLNWKNFGNLNSQLPYIDILQKSYLLDNSWKQTFKKIPSKLKELVVMSYQSYLWNECVKEIVKNSKNFQKIKYNIGELYFPNSKLENEDFPLIGRGLKTDNAYMNLINLILEREKLTLEEIGSISKSGNFLKSKDRSMIIYPKKIKIVDSYVDKLYTTNNFKRFAVILEFTLPKGSYATTTIKEIFRE